MVDRDRGLLPFYGGCVDVTGHGCHARSGEGGIMCDWSGVLMGVGDGGGRCRDLGGCVGREGWLVCEGRGGGEGRGGVGC